MSDFWGKKHEKKNIHFFPLQQVGMLFLHAGSSKPVERKISKLSMIIGFWRRMLLNNHISEVGWKYFHFLTIKFTYLGGDKCYQITKSYLCVLKKAGNEPHFRLGRFGSKLHSFIPLVIFIQTTNTDQNKLVR